MDKFVTRTPIIKENKPMPNNTNNSTIVSTRSIDEKINIDSNYRPTKYYGGRVYDMSNYPEGRNSWVVRFTKPTIDKKFPFSKFGGKRLAMEAAERFRIQKSEEFKLTIELHSAFHNPPSDEIQQYIIGFLDGDGTIGMSKPTNRNKNGKQCYNAKVTFDQSGLSDIVAPDVLLYIQQIYGGNTVPKGEPENINQRQGWQLNFLNIYSEVILKAAIKHGVIKSEQARLLLPFVQQCVPGQQRDFTGCEVVYQKLQAMKELKDYQSIEIDESRLTDAYVAGLFDAEGCIDMPSNNPRLGIAQTSSENLLLALQKKFGVGYVSSGVWYVCVKQDVLSVIDRLLPFSIAKKAQLEAVLAIRHIFPKHGTKRTRDEKDIVIDVASDLQRLKKM